MQQQWQTFLNTQGAVFSQEKLLHFGQLEQELDAIDTQNCLTSLSEWGILGVMGPDAKTFLQGQVTCNVNTLTQGKIHLAAHCNLKGRMQSLFSLFVENHNQDMQYYLKMPQSMLSFATQNFKKFAIFSKVTFEEMSSTLGIGLYGPDIHTILTSLFPLPVLNIEDCAFLNTAYGAIIVCRVPGGTHPRVELFANEKVLEALWLALKTSCRAVTPQCWELLDIRAGLPTIYPQTVDQILPHHANLSILGGISYDKGCYLGQEIIARMQYRGKIKKHMYRAYVQSERHPLPGDAVYVTASPETLGLVVRTSQTAKDRFELLVVLDDQYADFENVHLHSTNGPKLHRLELPYTWEI